MKIREDGSGIPKVWDGDTVRIYTAVAKSKIPATCKSIEMHDKGRIVLADEIFRQYAEEVRNFVTKHWPTNFVDDGSLFFK